MSLFRTIELPCPQCGAAVAFHAVDSVNAERARQYREQILADTFQSESCGACETRFRLDPEFTYIDPPRGQWIAAFPFVALGAFEEREAHAMTMMARSFGPAAPAAARGLGELLEPRVTFGWPALREKLVIGNLGLDDVTVELTKALVWRAGAGPKPNPELELRLLDQKGDKLVFAWLVSATSEVVGRVPVPASVYAGVAEDPEGWADLRSKLEGHYFVDLKRVLIS
jgi:hypothetical protein